MLGWGLKCWANNSVRFGNIESAQIHNRQDRRHYRSVRLLDRSRLDRGMKDRAWKTAIHCFAARSSGIAWTLDRHNLHKKYVYIFTSDQRAVMRKRPSQQQMKLWHERRGVALISHQKHTSDFTSNKLYKFWLWAITAVIVASQRSYHVIITPLIN